MSLVLNGSGTITGATTLASTVTSPTLTTPVITSTLGVGGATPSASGAGITFPASQSASSDANTLDDYEEGTFTPSISSGMTSPVYSSQVGSYTKVGRLVTITFRVTTSSGTLTGSQLIFSGLPFTQSADQGAGKIGYSNGGFNGSTTVNSPNIYVSGTTMEFYQSTGSVWNGTNCASSAFDVRGECTYFTT